MRILHVFICKPGDMSEMDVFGTEDTRMLPENAEETKVLDEKTEGTEKAEDFDFENITLNSYHLCNVPPHNSAINQITLPAIALTTASNRVKRPVDTVLIQWDNMVNHHIPFPNKWSST